MKCPRCQQDHPPHAKFCLECGTPLRDAIATPQRWTMVAEAVTGTAVTIVDPTPWFCTLEICPTIVGNVLVYRDAGHITTVYSTLLAPLLEHEIV